jgi:hypothetical protein
LKEAIAGNTPERWNLATWIYPWRGCYLTVTLGGGGTVPGYNPWELVPDYHLWRRWYLPIALEEVVPEYHSWRRWYLDRRWYLTAALGRGSTRLSPLEEMIPAWRKLYQNITPGGGVTRL